MKKFYEMSIIEVAECLTEQKYNGKEIDIYTAKDSLARVIPMLEDYVSRSGDVTDDPKLNHIKELIEKGKKILTQH